MRSVYVRRSLAAAVLVGTCALCFGRLVIHPAATLVGPQRGGMNDLTEYFQPVRVCQISIWRNFGQWPTWDPYLQLGRPLAGNPQSASYYPPNWLYLALGTERITSWLLVLHHLLGGWGMYLLCRRYKFARPAALAGGVVFLAAPYFVAQTAEGHYAQCTLAAWLPWALLCYERLRAGRRGSAALMALVLAMMFFCGHPQELYYLILALSAFWIYDLIRPGENVAPRASLAARWVGAGLLTLGLVAVDFLPIYATALQTSRGEGALSFAQVGGASPANLAQLIYPFALGQPQGMIEEGRYYWETLLYVGVAPLMLAGVGVALGWRRHPTVRYAILFVVCVIFALGASTPLFPLLHMVLPGMSKFRVPSRIMFLAAAAVAVLAASGVHFAMQMMGKRKALARLAVPIACGCAALIAVELSVHAWAVTRTISPADFRQGSPLTERLAGSAADYRVWISQELLSDQEAVEHQIAKARGYDPFYLSPLPIVLRAAFGKRPYAIDELPGYTTEPDLNYAPGPLDLLGVRYAAVAHHDAVDSSMWRLVERGEMAPRLRLRRGMGDSSASIPYSLYENTAALPRAFVLGHSENAVHGERIVKQLSHLDPRGNLIVEEDVLPAGERQDFTPAQMVQYTPSRVVVDARLDAPGYLVLTDMDARGWCAEVDGQPATIVPVDVAFRGVPLPPGEHRVEFTFDPPWRTCGAIVTALSLAAACVLLVWGFWNRGNASSSARRPDRKRASA